MIAKLGEDYGWMLRVVGDQVYFTAQTTSGAYLGRVAAAGGGIERIANLKSQPTSFAVVEGDLYLIAGSEYGRDQGTLWRIELSTGGLTMMDTALVGYALVTADDQGVAWLSGEDALILPTGQHAPRRIHP